VEIFLAVLDAGDQEAHERVLRHACHEGVCDVLLWVGSVRLRPLPRDKESTRPLQYLPKWT
jgi:hypothetical protein